MTNVEAGHDSCAKVPSARLLEAREKDQDNRESLGILLPRFQ